MNEDSCSILPMYLIGDPGRIKSILLNLALNAINYTTSNREAQINVFYDKFNQRLLFSISDEGIGINKEKESTIFSILSKYSFE